MCSTTIDQNTLQHLAETVQMFLDEGRMFSGYNITRVTRERLGIRLRHNEIRGDLHDIQSLKDAQEFGHTDPNGNDVEWKRTQVAVKGSTTGQWFFVYHRSTDDPTDFEQYDQQGGVVVDAGGQLHSAPTTGASLTATGQSQSASLAANANANAAADDDDANKTDSGGQNTDGSFSRDHYKRLFIPTRFLSEAGLSAGDTCSVIPDAGTNTILLVKDPSDTLTNGLTVTTKTVERNGDIRLRSNSLRAAGIDTDEKFVIENTDSESTKVVSITAQNGAAADADSDTDDNDDSDT
jgi:hypothetical protein